MELIKSLCKYVRGNRIEALQRVASEERLMKIGLNFG